MEKMFLKVSDVMKVLDVSESYAYKLIRKLNKELEKKGCFVLFFLLIIATLLCYTELSTFVRR